MLDNFPTAEEIKIIREPDNVLNHGADRGYFLEVYMWKKDDIEQLKQQILSDHIKAEKYDSLMKANSEIVQHNIDITKEHEIVERLREFYSFILYPTEHDKQAVSILENKNE